jgi:hypothetical protein
LYDRTRETLFIAADANDLWQVVSYEAQTAGKSESQVGAGKLRIRLDTRRMAEFEITPSDRRAIRGTVEAENQEKSREWLENFPYRSIVLDLFGRGEAVALRARLRRAGSVQ